MSDSNVNYSYPYSEDFEYFTELERINLDKEMERDIYGGNGFIVSEPRSIKKDIKDPNGIFSTKFGQTLGDMNPYIDRYKCECGNLRSRINHGLECPICHTKVRYVDDNYEYFGWMKLENYYIIHPNIYKSIEFFFGNGDKSDKDKRSKLYNILNYAGRLDQSGHEIPVDQFPPDQPYYGLGMIEFKEKFDEIMTYYLNKYPKKKEYYDDIMANKDKIFIQSIPVFTTHLRPIDIRDGSMYYEPINGMYNMMNILVHKINKNKTRFSRKLKPKNQLLFDLQQKYMELYEEVENILSGKKGKIRSLIGGQIGSCTQECVSSYLFKLSGTVCEI